MLVIFRKLPSFVNMNMYKQMYTCTFLNKVPNCNSS